MSRETTARFGLAFQASQPLSHYLECAKLADRYGFDMFQVYDDLLFKPAWPVLFAVATYASNFNSKITLGPGIVNPYHSHPALIATNIAFLDEESGGRAILMIGKGGFHDLFNIKPQRPLKAIREAIEIIDNLLSDRETNYDGLVFSEREGARIQWQRPYRIHDHKSPSGKREIPIWIGTFGPKTCQLAGKMKRVTGVMVSSITDPKYIGFLKENIEIGSKAVSRNPKEIEIGVVPGTIISNDRDKALKLAKEASAVYLPYLYPMTEFVGVEVGEINDIKRSLAMGDIKTAISRVSDKSVNAFKMWGTPDDVIEKIEKLVDGGVTRINFGFGRGPEDIEGIKLLGEKVLSYFKS